MKLHVSMMLQSRRSQSVLIIHTPPNHNNAQINILLWRITMILYVWLKYDLGQKYQAPQVQPDRDSNS